MLGGSSLGKGTTLGGSSFLWQTLVEVGKALRSTPGLATKVTAVMKKTCSDLPYESTMKDLKHPEISLGGCEFRP